MIITRFTFGLLVGAVLVGNPIAASAQSNAAPDTQVYSSDEDYPVLLRPRPEYDAKGIPLGGFRLFPTLDASASYDDNVFRTQANQVGDYFFDVAPTLRLQSQWAEDALEFYGGLNNYNYVTQSRENLTDWNGGADSRIKVTEAASLYAAGSAGEYHELLSSPNTVGFQASPNRFFLYHGEADTTIQPNRLGFTAGGMVDSYTFLNTPLIGGGFLNNKDRSFDEYQGYGKAFYDFSPGYSAFLRGSYDTRQYKVYLDRSGLHRSSDGYRIDGGVDMQVSRLVSGEIYVGYLSQNFTKPLKDINGLDYSVKLDWLASPLLTVHLTGARTLNQTTFAGASAEDDKSIGLSGDYELLRNVILQAHANYVDTSYPGITRHDESPDIGVNGKFLINEYAAINVGYTYTQRATNASGSKFQDNLVTIGLNLHD